MRIVVFGATGVAGHGVTTACLAAAEVEQVVVVVRRPIALSHAKLRELTCQDFADPSPLAPEFAGVDAVFYCLGIASAGMSEAEYRVITHDYALAAARVAKQANPKVGFHFISGGGTNPNSRLMWARVKGETELALGQLGLAHLTCWRPGYIHPLVPRERSSVGEGIIRTLYPVLRGMASMSVRADQIGEAMLEAQRTGRQGILDNREIRTLAAAYRARLNS